MQPLVTKGGELIEMGDRRFIDAEIDNEKMCALLFTSGTTGVSKGVMLSQPVSNGLRRWSLTISS